MKVCIPVSENNGLDSAVSQHFGSAPYFIIYDTERGRFETVENVCSQHAKGQCRPTAALTSLDVSAVACRGMGARAIRQLASEGIKALKSEAGSAAGVIEGLRRGTLPEMNALSACREHDCHAD